MGRHAGVRAMPGARYRNRGKFDSAPIRRRLSQFAHCESQGGSDSIGCELPDRRRRAYAPHPDSRAVSRFCDSAMASACAGSAEATASRSNRSGPAHRPDRCARLRWVVDTSGQRFAAASHACSSGTASYRVPPGSPLLVPSERPARHTRDDRFHGEAAARRVDLPHPCAPLRRSDRCQGGLRAFFGCGR